MKPLSETLKSVLNFRRNRVLLLIVPLGLGIAGCFPSQPAPSHLESALPASPTLEPNKPTVAVVLGHDLTEITDVIAPYVAFKTAAEFNVVLVSEQRQPVRLSGGLEVIPHFSFAQLDAQLGRDPDLIVVPNVPNIGSNEALRLWVQKHGRGKSLVMSVCAGAAMFAATGLIDGQDATTHWGDILWIEQFYRKVRWVRGQRYVDNGQFISTAGILSGIDGSLHMIARLRGKALAEQVATELHYPTQYLEHPGMTQHGFGFSDAIFMLKFMSPFGQPNMGVALFDGVDDMALAALSDVDVPWLAGKLEGIASRQVITTKHGIDLVARNTPEHWDASKEMLLPGTVGNPQQPTWLSAFHVTPTQARDDEFAFDTALKHLAQNADGPTAEYAAKRLEYRWFIP
jgi:putative intracellular protease/amidase